MGEGHLPVMVDEVIASLHLHAGSSVVDCTVGGGGHAVHRAVRLVAGFGGRPLRLGAHDSAGGV